MALKTRQVDDGALFGCDCDQAFDIVDEILVCRGPGHLGDAHHFHRSCLGLLFDVDASNWFCAECTPMIQQQKQNRVSHQVDDVQVVSQAPPAPEPTCKRRDSDNQYRRVMEHGYYRLIQKLTEVEKYRRDRAAVRYIDDEQLREQCLQILASTPVAFLDAIIGGNLQLARKQDAKVEKVAELAYNKNKDGQISIYMFEFVHKDTAESPTVRQLLEVIANAGQYENDARLAARVDRWKHRSANLADSQRGERAYLGHQTAPGVLQKLLQGLSVWLARFNLDEPLKQPMREVRYGGVGGLADHGRHLSLNYLMNLFEAIAHTEFHGRWVNKPTVIYNVWRAGQGSIADVLFTAISEADTDSGHGFNHFPAGLSSQLDKEEEDVDWRIYQHDAWYNSCYQRNIDAEMQRVQMHKAREEYRDRLLAHSKRRQQIAEQTHAENTDPLATGLMQMQFARGDLQARCDKLQAFLKEYKELAEGVRVQHKDKPAQDS